MQLSVIPLLIRGTVKLLLATTKSFHDLGTDKFNLNECKLHIQKINCSSLFSLLLDGMSNLTLSILI